MDKNLRSLKILDQQGLVHALLAKTDFSDRELLLMTTAVDLATSLHNGQMRQEIIQGRVNTPYIEHPLRNALRMIRWGVTDIDLLIATVLHDTVEDCGQVFVKTYTSLQNVSDLEARDLLSEHIGRTFGDRVLELVLAVTNPYFSRKQWFSATSEEKRQHYFDTVSKEIASNGDVFLVKLTDFIDNAGSLHWTPVDRHHVAHRLARKYHPLVIEFITQLHRHDLRVHIDEFTLVELKKRLQRIDRRLIEILTRP